MRSCSHSGSRPGQPDRAQAKERQCDRGHRPPTLYVVGIGPGSLDHISTRARQALDRADTIVGYGTYIDLIRPLVAGKPVVSTGMTKEVQRVEAALDAVRQGHTVALISSGDPGIYAMAGLVMEICAARELNVLPAARADTASGLQEQTLCVEVVPGIPALSAGGALLGAPLTHDFAVVSLSDLLTPWDVIERRLTAAAQADFVIVLYNPKSKKRDWQLQRAQEMILEHRDGRTPVGIVTSATRQEEAIRITTLAHLHEARVNMQTTVFIGNSSTRQWGEVMYTPRGYGNRYPLSEIRKP